MNAPALLALIADLYQQLADAQHELEQLRTLVTLAQEADEDGEV